MPVYDYAIGSSNPPTNLESLTTPINPPRSRYQEAAQFIDKADGGQRGQGFPTLEWVFDTLTQDMIDQLRAFCPTQSADVFLTTRILDGSFDTFSAVMLWPYEQLQQRVGANDSSDGIYQNITFRFRRLQAA